MRWKTFFYLYFIRFNSIYSLKNAPCTRPLFVFLISYPVVLFVFFMLVMKSFVTPEVLEYLKITRTTFIQLLGFVSLLSIALLNEMFFKNLMFHKTGIKGEAVRKFHMILLAICLIQVVLRTLY
ncbi:hypothetical protein OAT67_02545 [Bacteriovoracaceae bacterium]|nr:hypothetical protein [Bacteriovoracaceae bacterium]